MTATFGWMQISMAAVIAAAVGLALLPVSGLAAGQGAVFAVVLLTLVLWTTGAVPPYLASLMFFALTLIFGLATPDLVFAGFASAAVWLIVSGFVIGAAISASGLGARLADLMAPLLRGSYAQMLGGLMLAAMALGFLMPSSVGRAVVLVPIGMALADRCGFGKGSNGRIGIAVVLALGCNLPSFAILPANIPNMILSGAAETIHHVSFGYTDYLLLHYPVLGILKAALVVALALRLFPDRIAQGGQAPDPAPRGAGASTAVQLRVAAVLLVTLVLWMTDALHGINPAWIGLATAVILLLPRIGVVAPASFKTSVDFGLLLFVAGALALGALVNQSGLGAQIGRAMQQVLPLEPGRDALNFLSLSLMSVVTGLIATVPGVPAVLTPLAPDLATQSGLGIETVLMTQVIGFSTVLFPYQVAPLVVAMQLAGEKPGHLIRISLPLAALTLLLLLPLDYLWWRLWGWI